MLVGYVKQLLITIVLLILIAVFGYITINGEKIKQNINNRCKEVGGVMEQKQCKLPNGEIKQFSFSELRGIKK